MDSVGAFLAATSGIRLSVAINAESALIGRDIVLKYKNFIKNKRCLYLKKGYPNFLGVFARNLGVNFGGEKK